MEQVLEVSFLDYKGARARLSHPEPKALFNRSLEVRSLLAAFRSLRCITGV
jgi:hypothetical protein